MRFAYIGLIFLLCVIEIQSERYNGFNWACNGCQHEGYSRNKRAKYYPSPLLRFYNRQPISYPIRGAYPFTTPPGWMDDDRQMSIRPKVRRPVNEALGDDHNMMTFLSKHELDKLMEFASDSEREPQRYGAEPFEKPNDANTKTDISSIKGIFNSVDPELYAPEKFSHIEPFARYGFKPHSIQNNHLNFNELKELNPSRFPDLESSDIFMNRDKIELNTLSNFNREQNQPFANLNAFRINTYQDVDENRNDGNIFTDSSIMQEEPLPKPTNLREDDYEASYTNNVVVKTNSDSYKVENLGDLPLMNYQSKLGKVDSYKVPHYTVTSPEKYGQASSSKVPVEPAPPVSTAKEQSDAHLRAIKIWTHRSKGTAYTLHEDGTLSLEMPLRPKTNYG